MIHKPKKPHVMDVPDSIVRSVITYFPSRCNGVFNGVFNLIKKKKNQRSHLESNQRRWMTFPSIYALTQRVTAARGGVSRARRRALVVFQSPQCYRLHHRTVGVRGSSRDGLFTTNTRDSDESGRTNPRALVWIKLRV